MHECVFCPEQFPDLTGLIRHLMERHQVVIVDVPAGPSRRLYFYRTFQDYKVLCFCGERFTVNQVLSDPLFGNRLSGDRSESNSFLAHLKREGGLKRHLERVRQEALLDRIDGKDYDPFVYEPYE